MSLDLSTPSFPFVEILARSNFSFLLGASHPDEMVRTAQAHGYQGLGLCDLNGLYGVARGFREAFGPNFFEEKAPSRSQNFRFHVGTEMTLPDGNVCLLPMNKKGYGNLCRLITESKRAAPKGFSALQDHQIFFHNEDLIACLLPPWNIERLQAYQKVFGDRLYLPVYRDLTWDSQVICNQAWHFEKEGFQLFVTQRPFFHEAQRKKLHDVLTCLYHKKTLQEAQQILLPNSERRLHSLPELEWLWKDRPDLLAKTVEISDRLKFSLKEIRYKYPQSFLPLGKTSAEFLKELCEKGIQERFPQGFPQKLQHTLTKELEIVRELEYEDYFLTLWEVCQFAKEKNILYQGRGSAANSLVCYLIGLTAVHPEKIGLLFERFISKERNEPPDIDIDFEHERREEVIQHIYQKYGSDRAAMVCNVICYRTKMALREVCKVLGIPEAKVSELVRFMGREGFQRLLETPRLFEKYQIDPDLFRQAMELVSQLRGFPRHLGIHSGGFVMTEDCLLDSVPVEKATMEGRYVVQWNKDDIETLQLMKVDLLSLGMLTALRKCMDLLRTHKGKDFHLYSIPDEPEDGPTYKMIGRADTVGVFQIESRAQMTLLPRLKPKNYYDLVIEVAIVRPGPIQGGMIHPYLKRRDKKEEPFYPHPKLIPILERTLGVPLFQEQVMQILVDVAGFTPGEADQMRRIMSNAWRRPGQMMGLKKRIYDGLRQNRIPESYIENIYKTVEGFASYGFPESHSASFALLTYASCYIKQHFPDVFVCGILNSQPMGFYTPRSLIADAQRHGVQFLPLSVQYSEEDYTLVPDSNGHKVRVGLRSIYGVSKSYTEKLIRERNKNGPFKDLSDLIKRTKFTLPILLKFAQAGALMDFGMDAREALWKLPSFFLDQDSFLFGHEDDSSHQPKQVEWRPPKANSWEEMTREYSSTGFSIDRHPLLLLRPQLHRLKGFITSKELAKTEHRKQIRFVGLLSIQQKPPTAKGVSFLTLEDEFGFFNIVLMPDVYEKSRLLIRANPILEVIGRLEKVGDVLNVIASHVRPAPLFREQANSNSAGQPDPKMIKPRMFI